MKATPLKSITAGFICPAIVLLSASTGFQAQAEPIFNGKDLSGWYGLNPHKVAKVTEDKKKAAIEGFQKEFKEHWSFDNG